MVIEEACSADDPGDTVPYQLQRLQVVMRPRSGDPLEEGGVLNPAGVRAPNGDYLLFPRLVAAGNYSRVGMARLTHDPYGIPCGVERLGVALQPEQPYEINGLTGGGCEDPRITHVPALGLYVMLYVAYGPNGPRAAMAVSRDLDSWSRRGLIDFAPYHGADMNIYGNKDAMVFPEPVPGPDGRPSIALLHRPMYESWEVASGQIGIAPLPPGVSDHHWTMWISYCPLERADWAASPGVAPTFDNHHMLIRPEFPWEAVRLGGGTPPVRIPEGWFTIYHGIGRIQRPNGRPGLRYVAAALVLDPRDPRRVLYRSSEPILAPLLPEERSGVVSDVVFPTAVDQHKTYLDVYYGMADACIGAARMEIAPDRR